MAVVSAEVVDPGFTPSGLLTADFQAVAAQGEAQLAAVLGALPGSPILDSAPGFLLLQLPAGLVQMEGGFAVSPNGTPMFPISVDELFAELDSGAFLQLTVSDGLVFDSGRGLTGPATIVDFVFGGPDSVRVFTGSMNVDAFGNVTGPGALSVTSISVITLSGEEITGAATLSGNFFIQGNGLLAGTITSLSVRDGTFRNEITASGLSLDLATFNAALVSGASLLSVLGNGTLSGSDRIVLEVPSGVSFNAGAGNDFLTGDDGGDTLLGAAGNDTVSGTDGNDSLTGAGGNDSLLGGNGNDTILGGGDNDTLTSTGGNDSLAGGGGHDSILSGAGDDAIAGGNGNDTMTGAGGNDTQLGGEHDDSLLGGGGNDSADGGNGDDTLVGGADNDTLFGDAGDDSIAGDEGNDSLMGAAGNDKVEGGGGNDSIFGGAGDDVLAGQGGNDTLSGGNGDDTLRGGGGNDSQLGGMGNDAMFGGNGNDTLAGNAGDDFFDGGEGNDVYQYAATVPGAADVGAGDAETIVGIDAGDRLDISDELAAFLTVEGALIADADTLGGAIDGSNNVAFDDALDLLMIDVNGDGVFSSMQDFSIELAGVSAVSYVAAASSFSFTI